MRKFVLADITPMHKDIGLQKSGKNDHEVNFCSSCGCVHALTLMTEGCVNVAGIGLHYQIPTGA